MTKLDWDKVDYRQPDPGRVVQPGEEFQSAPWTPPHERAKKLAAKEQRRQELLAQSEEHDRQLKIAGYFRRLKAGERLDPWDEMIFKGLTTKV